jgi:DNA-binding GntR family transcriptional regulator
MGPKSPLKTWLPSTTCSAYWRATRRAWSPSTSGLLAIASKRWRDHMVADLRKVMKLNRHNSLLKTGRIAESLAEHQAIMAALLARDAQRTQERMREHFANGLEAAQ